MCVYNLFQQHFGIKTAGLEEKATACQMLVCYARELKEGFAPYTEEVVNIMVPLLNFYFHDGILFDWKVETSIQNLQFGHLSVDREPFTLF